MSEIREEFFNGYCKNYDMARTAIGEFCRDKECFFWTELIAIMETVPMVRTVK